MQVCVVILAAVALAAPEGARDKRGFLHGGWSSGLGHSSLELGHGSLGHAPVLESYSAPAHIVSVNKIVHVPKVVEFKKIVSVPKVVSVPQIVKVSKIVESPHYSSGYSSGWW
ncbi:uncharacterized protein LOC120631810 [Pararge aegeria]|uniref:uncharacterized protein LOC120631810 n=1 Tax=Pararge aegeria TaxID=116150 RepID=UPI0019D2E382|nr:uncharacterized protein LOC120631810 [Pararge aegeria]